MFSEEIRDLAKSNVMQLIEVIKKSQGMTVSSVSKELDLSYMGAKQLCEKLENAGYLKTWRVPRQSSGRPEKLYMLTPKCDALFPQAGLDVTLQMMDGMKQFFGASAPEKVLFHYYEQQRLAWSKKLSQGKSMVEKATLLVDLREKSGVFCKCHYSPEEGFWIEEYHHPMQELFKMYPSSLQHELRMMEQLVGTRIEREIVKLKKGGEMVVYRIAVLG